MTPITKELCEEIFTKAGLTPLKLWELPNKYWHRPPPVDPNAQDFNHRDFSSFVYYMRLREESPWWLVQTEIGLIEIGARKRVISIDWGETDITGFVTNDDVTKGLTYVHAWSVEDAIRYLKRLSEHEENLISPND